MHIQRLIAANPGQALLMLGMAVSAGRCQYFCV